MTPLEARLAELAATGQTASYGALSRELGLRMRDLTAALEALMEQDARAGQPLRAALCKGKLSQELPAQGFFMKCAELGIDVDNPATFVAWHRMSLSGSDQ